MIAKWTSFVPCCRLESLPQILGTLFSAVCIFELRRTVKIGLIFETEEKIQSQKRNLAWIHDRSKAIAVFTIYCTNHIINQPKLISRNSEVASLGSWRRKFFYCKWTKITQIFLKLVLSPFYFVTVSVVKSHHNL